MNNIIKKDFVDNLIDKVKGKGIGIRIETKEVNVSVWDTSKEVVTKWERIQSISIPQQKPQAISDNKENSLERKPIELVKNTHETNNK